MCKLLISRHIKRLPTNEIFTSRDMLIYGKRRSVDSALSRMVNKGTIVRLTGGVFIQAEAAALPSAFEIAQAKAKAYGMRIVEHAEHFLKNLNLLPEAEEELVFAKSGGSTSFLTVHGRVYLKGTCAKKLLLAETEIGQILYALWHLGKERCSENHVRVAKAEFKRTERRDLWLSAWLIPSWLNEVFRSWHPAPEIAIRDDTGRYSNSNLRAKLENSFSF